MLHSRSWKRVFRFWRSDVTADVDAEMRFHLDARVADLVKAGRSPDAARAEALAEFGDTEQVAAELRDIDHRIARNRARSERVSAFLTDLRLAARSLIRTPAFTIAAVLTMALGVGINSVIFSAVNGVLLQPLDYPAPAELIALFETRGGSAISRTAGSPSSVSPANLMDYRRESSSFTGLAAYDAAGMAFVAGGTPQRVFVVRITANFFDVLGVQPRRGRTLKPGDDTFGGPKLAVLSDEMWRRLGADTAIVGTSIRLDDEAYEVIGVLPAGFRSPNQDRIGEPPAAYVPTGFPPKLLGPDGHGDHMLDVVARLKHGVAIETAQADLARISKSLESQYPGTNMGVRAIITPLRDAITSTVRVALLVLMGAVGFVWLVACVNLANLMLVRAVSRRRELSVRVALGASRARVLQPLVAQGIVISAAGCAAGLALGVILKSVLVGIAPPGMPRMDSIAFSGPVFGVAAALSLVAGIAFGVIPAWRMSRADIAQGLRDGERNTGTASVRRWQRGLVVAEVALSCVLLIGSALLLRSFASVMGVDLGFRTDNVLAAAVTLPRVRYPDPVSRLRFFEAVAERLRTAPGVKSVAFANRMPLRGGWGTGLVSDLTVDTTKTVDTNCQAVNPGYFATFGINLVKGRLITDDDRSGTLPVVVVNEELVRRFFPGQDPIGHRVRRSADWLTIVGVVTDVRRDGKVAKVAPEAYLAAAQTQFYPVVLGDIAVSTDGNPAALAGVVRDAVLAVDPNQPVANVRTMSETVSRSVAIRRFEATLITLFAATSMLLALVGIFGVVSYTVAQRTREFGLRLALGARASRVVGEVLANAGTLVITGLAIGAIGAFWLSRYLQSFLFGVEPTDLATYGIVGAALAVAGLVACVIPARRAAAVDPVVALRAE